MRKKLKRFFLNPVLRKLKAWLEEIERDEEPENVPFDNDYRWFKSQLLHFANDPVYWKKPEYVWGIMQAAALGKALKYESISILEFGTAAGGGLKAMEVIAQKIEKAVGIQIEVHGFDTGKGMPMPNDYRDCPNLFDAKEYDMDFRELTIELKKASLHIGFVKNTLEAFKRNNMSPVGFVAFDLDYYSSTRDALAIFDSSQDKLLPRVLCYFDDIFIRSYCEWNGPLLAIHEFNAKNENKKMGKVNGLRYFLPLSHHKVAWPDGMYYMHSFDHPKYNEREFISTRHH